MPERLGNSFHVRDAATLGLGRSRYEADDLARPFHGVRARTASATPLQRVGDVLPRLRPGQIVGGRTALRVWGYPFPFDWSPAEDVVIAVRTGGARPRTRGIQGRRLAAGRVRPVRLDGIPLMDPVAALFMCARELVVDQLVVLTDALITTAVNYPGLHDRRPLITPAEIDARCGEWGRFPGVAGVRAALSSAREGVESPKETETRLLLLAGGLPEPTVQHVVREGGRVVARVDLAYPALRIAIEYEGDGHRTSRAQWRRDIQRQRELEDLGWVVIRVTELDLADGGAPFLARVRRAVTSRSMSGPISGPRGVENA